MYSSSDKIRMIKSRSIRWAGHLARMDKRRMHIGFRWESQKCGTGINRLRSFDTTRCLATAVLLAPLFRLSGVMSHCIHKLTGDT
jgi:hypothetical protein